MKIQLHCSFINIDIYRCQTLTLDNEDARATDCGVLQLVCNLESGNSSIGSWNVFGTAASKANTPEKNHSREQAPDKSTQV